MKTSFTFVIPAERSFDSTFWQCIRRRRLAERWSVFRDGFLIALVGLTLLAIAHTVSWAVPLDDAPTPVDVNIISPSPHHSFERRHETPHCQTLENDDSLVISSGQRDVYEDGQWARTCLAMSSVLARGSSSTGPHSVPPESRVPATWK